MAKGKGGISDQELFHPQSASVARSVVVKTEIQKVIFRQIQTTEILSNLGLQKYRVKVQASEQVLGQPAAQYYTAAAAYGFQC